MVTVLRWLRAGLVPVALAGMLVVTGLVLSRIYSGELMTRLLFAAAAGSVLVSVLVHRLPGWTAAPCSILALGGLTLLAVRLSAQAGRVPGTVPALTRDAIVNGIPRVLTAMIPIEPQPDTVVVPIIVSWLAGLAATEIALRWRRVLLSYTAPTALLSAALFLVGPNAGPALWAPLAYAGCAALGLAASATGSGLPAGPTLGTARAGGGNADGTDPGADTGPGTAGGTGPGTGGAGSTGGTALTRAQRSTLGVRVAAGAAVGLAAIIALAAAVGPSIAGRVDTTPTDPRRYVTPPQLNSLDESPLVRLSGWALNPDQHLFDATVTGAPTARIRLAVLSDYDGVTWRVGGTYRNAGRVLTGPPAVTPPAGPSRDIEQRITIDELDGRLLPAVATPQRVDGVRIAYDMSSGTMAVPDGLRPGLSYAVASRQPTIEVNLLPVAEVPTGPSVGRYTILPGTVPADVTKLAQQLGSGVPAPYQRALAIEQFLAEHYGLTADAPSGHAYPNIDYFLFGPRNAGGQRGTSEQFAAAFAVLARALGLPTRLVVGFPARAGTNAIRGRDAVAWPEVLFDGLGWVDFNPLPQPNITPRPVEEDFRPKPDPSNPPPTQVATPSVPPAPRPSPAASGPVRGDRAGPPVRLLLTVVGGASGLFAVCYAIVVPVLRAKLRRRRLRPGTPARVILGAWAEVLDALRLAGRPALPHLAATEVARHALAAAAGPAHGGSRRSGNRRSGNRRADHRPPDSRPPAPPPPIDRLAELANAMAFAPVPPTTEQARLAAGQAMSYVDDLRSRRSAWRRLLWTLDPRPLRWWRDTDRAMGPPGAGPRRRDRG